MAAERHAVLFGCEVWIIDGVKPDTTIEFKAGTFAQARHAHVFAVGDKVTAIRVTGALKPAADAAMYKDLNREHDGTQGR